MEPETAMGKRGPVLRSHPAIAPNEVRGTTSVKNCHRENVDHRWTPFRRTSSREIDSRRENVFAIARPENNDRRMAGLRNTGTSETGTKKTEISPTMSERAVPAMLQISKVNAGMSRTGKTGPGNQAIANVPAEKAVHRNLTLKVVEVHQEAVLVEPTLRRPPLRRPTRWISSPSTLRLSSWWSKLPATSFLGSLCCSCLSNMAGHCGKRSSKCCPQLRDFS